MLEISPSGEIIKEVSILPSGVSNAGQGFIRNARRLENGNYLVAHYKDHIVKEYDTNGKVVWSVEAPGGAHSVIRLPNGNTLIAITDRTLKDGTKNPRIIEVNNAGETVWEISNKDIPGEPLRFLSGMQYFSDGRLLFTNWVGYEKSTINTHLFLVTKDKEIICTIGDREGIKTMSSVYSMKKNSGKPILSYH